MLSSLRSVARAAAIFAVALLFLSFLESLASACPTCKETLAANDPDRQNLVRGYFYSILFMLSMPFTILVGLGGYFYYEVKKARRMVLPTAKPSTPSA